MIISPLTNWYKKVKMKGVKMKGNLRLQPCHDLGLTHSILMLSWDRLHSISICGKVCTFTSYRDQLKESIKVKLVKGVIQQSGNKWMKDVYHKVKLKG